MDVSLVVVADEIADRVPVAVRPRVEIGASRVLVPAVVEMPAEAAQDHRGQDCGADFQSQTLHRSRVMRSGGR